MKIIDCEQNSPEWYQARLGIPTASAFSSIITPGGKASASAAKYRLQLLAEWLGGAEMETWGGNFWTERGKELEPEAIAYYEMVTGSEVQRIGFATLDDGSAGASPDGLIGDDGALEVKCPAGWTHVDWLLQNQLPREYIPQVQGQLYVLERQWADFLSYHPALPPLIIRVHKDDNYQALLMRELAVFKKRLNEQRAALHDRGLKGQLQRRVAPGDTNGS